MTHRLCLMIEKSVCRPWIWLIGVVLGFSVLMPTAGAAQATPVVERISFSAQDDGQGYVVRIHTTEQLAAYSEPRFVQRNQLEVILFNTQLSSSYRQEIPGGPVQAYTVQPRQGHLVLLFQLDGQIPIEATASRDRATDHMLLGLTYVGEALPMASAPAYQGDALASDDDRGRWRLDTIVIDAGHGGHDAGAIGAGGVREKDVVLAVALRVGRYLEELLGVNVIYTREDDRFITLRDRGRIANVAEGKLFISIHANAASNRRAQGT